MTQWSHSTHYRSFRRRFYGSHDPTNSVIIIIIISTTMLMVLSSWQSHCESSPGSFDECRMAPTGRRPKTKPDDLGCESACTGCQKLHPPSPFIIITQPESWYSFYRPTEGRRLSRFRTNLVKFVILYIFYSLFCYYVSLWWIKLISSRCFRCHGPSSGKLAVALCPRACNRLDLNLRY